MTTTERAALEAEARRLGCYPDPEARSDAQLRGAIAADRAAAAWILRFEALPSDEQKRAAVHKLRLAFDALAAHPTHPTQGEHA